MGKRNLRDKDRLHPLAAFFHLAFKVAAISVYLLSGWFTQSFLVPAVAVILLLSLDFWIVKNITGRLLVGLRWRNYVDENGKNRWLYERDENLDWVDRGEEKLFWFSQAICTTLWLAINILTIFGSFEWFIIATIAFALNMTNLYGYLCCSYDIKNKLAETIQKYLLEGNVKKASPQAATPMRAHLILDCDIEMTPKNSLQQKTMKIVTGAESNNAQYGDPEKKLEDATIRGI